LWNLSSKLPTVLDPDKLTDASPAEVLEAAARGHLGVDHRFLHALLHRQEQALPAVIEFSKRDRSVDAVDLAPEIIAIFRHLQSPEALPFLIDYIKEDPADIPDEVIEALVEIGQPALEPLLQLYGELDESESGEIAFILANLRVRDDRILQLLLDRLEFDLSDTALLLSIYGDGQARPALEQATADLPPSEAALKKEITDALESLDNPVRTGVAEQEPFDIWSLYPEREDLPVDLLEDDERLQLLGTASAPAVRAAAAASFFNSQLTAEQRNKLLAAATTDESPTVRARAWEALMNETEEPGVVEAMLKALRNPEITGEERSGLLVGLAPEADRNEVREAIIDLYGSGEYRAKALEAMWRSMHPGFRDYFAKHLDDADLETRRGAIWGIGYYGLKGELDGVRKLFNHEELRSDALFAYALAIPSEISRGRMKGLLARIEKEAHGLSDLEEDLVKAALDERLMLAGKEPFFSGQQD
jgi:HEAT repeat protein